MLPETGCGRVPPAAWGYFARSFLPANVVDEKPRYGEGKPANVRKTTHRGSARFLLLFRLKRFRGTKHIIELTWFRLKRFLGTKRLIKCTWYRLKRFRGTK